ncbi:MAG TPA: iron uptake porin [Cyanophyceae cyanobacterium]
MERNATTWKGWLAAPATLWASLLTAHALMYVMPSPATAEEVRGTVAVSSVPQESNTAEDSVEAPILNPVTSVAQLASDRGTLEVQDSAVIPSATTLDAESGDAPADALTLDDVTSVAEFSSVEEGSETDDPMAQVTNVSQLRDVSPGDWAYEALRSLVERYGCIAGYPDGTYRGNRAMSRYEFAAGLNACLNQIQRLLIADESVVTPEAFETLQRLVQEFQTELTSLGTRVDNLEGRVGFLEDHQFSTTTKLNGLAWFNLTGAFAGDDVKVEATNLNPPFELRTPGRDPITNKPLVQKVKDDPGITLSNLVWLTFQTSFTGRDSLVTQLAAGNGISPANTFASAGLFNTFGVPFFDQTAGTEVFGSRNDVIVRDFFYQFPVSDQLQVVVGPRINWYRFFDNNAYTFILTGANTFNSNSSTFLNTIDRGSGAVALWTINDKLKLHLGYLGENDEFLPSQFGFNTASNPNKGLFNATYTATAELTFSPTNAINLRLIYNYSKIDANVPIAFDVAGNPTAFGVGGATGEPITGVADDGFGGGLRYATAHTFGVNFDWQIASSFGVFGRYSYANTNTKPKRGDRSDGEINAQSFQVGLAFPDLGKEGALGTLSFLVPFDVLDGRKFLVSGGGNGGTQYEIEASYFYPITNNIALVPAFYLIGNPNNFDDNPTIYVGNLRAQFSF